MKMQIKATMTGSVFLLLSLFLLASCGGGGGGYGGGGGTPPSSTVQIVTCPVTADATVNALASSFTPTGVTISANQIVKWNNASGVNHTVTRTTQPAGGTFDVALNNLTSVCLKFTTAGVFDYYCTVHGITMNGSVTVTP
jgi:plastocyanin